MARESMRQLCDNVCGRRRNQEKIGAIGERDVTRMPVLFLIVKAGRDRIF